MRVRVRRRPVHPRPADRILHRHLQVRHTLTHSFFVVGRKEIEQRPLKSMGDGMNNARTVMVVRCARAR